MSASPAPAAPAGSAGAGDYSHLDTPAVWRSREGAGTRATGYDEAATERLDIPAFLRKQAD